MRTYPSILTLGLASCLAALAPDAAAQQPPPPPFGPRLMHLPAHRSRVAGPGVEGFVNAPEADAKTAAEAATVKRLVQALQSDDVQERRRAAMVIGKYASPAAVAATIRCLEDPDDAVRQSALVALTEEDFIPAAAHAPIIRLLADPSLAIRRLAASALQQLFLGAPMVFRGGGTIMLPGRELAPDLRTLISFALENGDPFVRKSILGLRFALARIVTPAAVQRNLADPDKEIRVLALQACTEAFELPPAEFFTVCAPLCGDPEPVVRKAAAAALVVTGDAALPALRRLRDDGDPGVVVAALTGLAMLGDADVAGRAVPLLGNDAVPLDARLRLLRELSQVPGGIGALRTSATTETLPLPLRVEALRTLAVRPTSDVPTAFFLGLLDQPSRDLRRAAAQALLMRRDVGTPEITRLCQQKDAEVRLVAVDLAARLPPDQAAGFIADLLLDDDVAVRVSALRATGMLLLPEWQKTLTLSLDDPDPAVQRAAVEALLFIPDPAAESILRKTANSAQHKNLAEFIRERLPPPLPAVPR